MAEKIGNRYIVILGALLVQLCLGSIYAWSFFQTALREGVYTWPSIFTQLPFAAGLASFALFMILAGRWQDNVGPRKVATFGGILLGLGYILAMLVDLISGGEPVIGTIWLIVTYGIIGGAGIGFAYVCPIAALVRWFPDRKGAITGIAVAGFGAGALVFGYVEDVLLVFFSVPASANIGIPFGILGVVYLALVVLGAQVLVCPPDGWLPEGFVPPSNTADGKGIDILPSEMIRDNRFRLLWLAFVFAATAGLMTLGNVKSASQLIDPATIAVVIVGVMSLLNAAGRIFWGSVSDKLGRENTMMSMFFVLAVAMFIFALISSIGGISWYAVMAIASTIGFCFGGNFALFPSATADFWGSKNVGKNYGIMFTAYGIAGILGGLVAGSFVDFFQVTTGSEALGYAYAFTTTGLLAILALVLVFVVKRVYREPPSAAGREIPPTETPIPE